MIQRTARGLAMAGLLIGAVGCQSSRPPDADGSSTRHRPSASGNKPSQTAPATQPWVDAEKYAGPPAHLQVLHLESFPERHVAHVRINVPSGGWTINLDHAEVQDGVAKLQITLERPGRDEMVTQSLETLELRFESTDPPFRSAEAWIHLARRDEHTLTTNYRLAARSPE